MPNDSLAGRRKVQTQPKSIFKPSLSIIVPAHNCERLIPLCLTSLFKSTALYLGFCEIIVIDDGSSDNTYEIAWATIQECKRKWPQVSGKVVRHTAKLGRSQAIKTGVNKAFGTVIAIIDPKTSWKVQSIKGFVENIEKCNKRSFNLITVLYRADTLRKLL